MAQIFTATADTRLRAFLLLVAGGVVGLVLFVTGYLDSSYATLVGWTQEQPVPFSHEHHAGELEIDCRYCHTTVETGAEAGLPPTETCMTCHSQVWTGAPVLEPVRQSLASGEPIRWNRVASVADYVFFNHAIHLDRGVPCVECHGRVDRMPLTWRAEEFQMSWCLECHRDPAPRLRPPEMVTRMDWSDWGDEPWHALYGAEAVERHGIEPARLDSCGICHR